MKAETRPIPRSFGRKKCIKDTVLNRLRNARSRILDDDLHSTICWTAFHGQKAISVHGGDCIINHGDSIVSGQVSGVQIGKMALTVVVP